MKKRGAVIGTFDGVHRGHKLVTDTLKSVASSRNLQPVAITFSQHPLSVINPDHCPLSITSLEDKTKLLANAGVYPLVMEFNQSLRDTTAREWLKRLRQDFNVEALVIGYDTSFGSDCKSLSLEDYVNMGKMEGIEVIKAPHLPGISSSAVRDALSVGDVSKASEMLGRPYTLSGTVVEGNNIGHTLGFPTANLIPDPSLAIPSDGVYEALATLPDGSLHKSMVNIGYRPTINGKPQQKNSGLRTIETHVIDWSGDLYNKVIALEFLRRIRDEQKFQSLEDLQRRLQLDKEIIKNSKN